MTELNVEIVRRLHRQGKSRQKVLEVLQRKMIQTDIPFNKNPHDPQICSDCNLENAEWYIFACQMGSILGLTNGVTPGFKCNRCKETFLRQYLRPNWAIDGDQNLLPHKSWQTYGLVRLSSVRNPTENPSFDTTNLGANLLPSSP
jgi:hypothetical protein